jgi:hypothetical protein
MNGDEVVRKSTLYLFVPSAFPQSWDVWTKLYQVDIRTVGCLVRIAYRERVP